MLRHSCGVREIRLIHPSLPGISTSYSAAVFFEFSGLNCHARIPAILFNTKGGDTMAKRLKDLMVFNGKPVVKDKTLFNGQLLDQRREDVYVVLHQMGIIR
jgi:hypothetical protein